MRTVAATLMAPSARAWLQAQATVPEPVQAGFLSATVANLYRSDGQLLSLVTPAVGPSPFSLLLAQDLRLNERIDPAEQPLALPDRLLIGRLAVDLRPVRLWSPKPTWPAAPPSPTARACLRRLLTNAPPGGLAPLIQQSPPTSPLHNAAGGPVAALSQSLEKGDLPAAVAAANGLTGLGPGLTPAGDDFLIGLTYALWYQWPAPIAGHWAAALAQPQPGTTTRLAVAYRTAAGRGEATPAWQAMVAALNGGTAARIRAAGKVLLAIGHTSGADGLAGFLFGLERGRG